MLDTVLRGLIIFLWSQPTRSGGRLQSGQSDSAAVLLPSSSGHCSEIPLFSLEIKHTVDMEGFIYHL